MRALAGQPWFLVLVIGGVALVVAMLASQLAARRRRRDLLVAIEASTRGTTTLFPVRAWGTIACTLTPPPAPFKQLFIYFTMRPRPAPLGIVSRLFGGRSQRMEIRGILAAPPACELTWQRNLPPDRATGRGATTELWTVQRLPASHGEYALRGANARGLEHLFIESFFRYGGFLQRVLVRSDRAPHVVFVLTANGLNAEDIPALVTTICALGRAAVRE